MLQYSTRLIALAIAIVACGVYKVHGLSTSRVFFEEGSLVSKPGCCYYMSETCKRFCYDENQQALKDLLYMCRNTGADFDFMIMRTFFTPEAKLCNGQLLCGGRNDLEDSKSVVSTGRLIQLKEQSYTYDHTAVSLKSNNTFQVINTSTTFTSSQFETEGVNYLDVISSRLRLEDSKFISGPGSLAWLQDSMLTLKGSQAIYMDTVFSVLYSSIVVEDGALEFKQTSEDAVHTDEHLRGVVPALYVREGQVSMKNSVLKISGQKRAYMLRGQLSLTNSALVLENSNLFLFDSSLKLENANIHLKNSTLWLYNTTTVGDNMFATLSPSLRSKSFGVTLGETAVNLRNSRSEVKLSSSF